MVKKSKRSSLPAWAWFGLTLLAIGLFTTFGPPEHSLGTNVRVVYLHGAWVWTALAGFVAAGVAGLAGLLTRGDKFHCWSRALGLTGLFFWITYLPISLWAMQANWNGLFLAEPRWRLALVFSIVGLLLQAGLVLLARPAWTSLGNLVYVIVLVIFLQTTANVMHPASPILSSEATRIQFYFSGLLALTLVAAWQVARFVRHAWCAAPAKS